MRVGEEGERAAFVAGRHDEREGRPGVVVALTRLDRGASQRLGDVGSGIGVQPIDVAQDGEAGPAGDGAGDLVDGGFGVVQQRHTDAGAHGTRAVGEEEPVDAQATLERRQAAGECEQQRAGDARLAGDEQRSAVAEAQVHVGERGFGVVGGRGRAQVVGGDRDGGFARPVGQPQFALDGLTLDVEFREQSVEPARHPPGLRAQKGEHGGDQGHAHEERVDGDADSEAEGDGFEARIALGDERDEHREHDHGRGHDHTR
ncbi:hypothetical protein SRABI128_00542 [Microbacterium sp. Bi128]|nr:hypothetical protein SRABI128_00542 [Microbacterium sp. Bi128]